MQYFLVYFIDGVPLERYAIPSQEIQESGQESSRALLCTSVSGMGSGFVRLTPKEPSVGGKEVTFHVPQLWIAAIAEASKESNLGFRVAPQAPHG
jgi:hypothetical protein